MSESGLRRIEKSGKPIRESSLGLILSALASVDAISENDQIWVSQLAGVRLEDIQSMCERQSSKAKPSSSANPQSTVRSAQTLVFRLQSAIDSILASGAEVEAIELLESIARWSVASRHAIDDSAKPVHLTPREREAVRAFRVAHPHRMAQSDDEPKGAIIEDFSHYTVDDDGSPRPLRPTGNGEPDGQPEHEQQSDQSEDKNAG